MASPHSQRTTKSPRNKRQLLSIDGGLDLPGLVRSKSDQPRSDRIRSHSLASLASQDRPAHVQRRRSSSSYAGEATRAQSASLLLHDDDDNDDKRPKTNDQALRRRSSVGSSRGLGGEGTSPTVSRQLRHAEPSTIHPKQEEEKEGENDVLLASAPMLSSGEEDASPPQMSSSSKSKSVDVASGARVHRAVQHQQQTQPLASLVSRAPTKRKPPPEWYQAMVEDVESLVEWAQEKSYTLEPLLEACRSCWVAKSESTSFDAMWNDLIQQKVPQKSSSLSTVDDTAKHIYIKQRPPQDDDLPAELNRWANLWKPSAPAFEFGTWDSTRTRYGRSSERQSR